MALPAMPMPMFVPWAMDPKMIGYRAHIMANQSLIGQELYNQPLHPYFPATPLTAHANENIALALDAVEDIFLDSLWNTTIYLHASLPALSPYLIAQLEARGGKVIRSLDMPIAPTTSLLIVTGPYLPGYLHSAHVHATHVPIYDLGDFVDTCDAQAIILSAASSTGTLPLFLPYKDDEMMFERRRVSVPQETREILDQMMQGSAHLRDRKWMRDPDALRGFEPHWDDLQIVQSGSSSIGDLSPAQNMQAYRDLPYASAARGRYFTFDNPMPRSTTPIGSPPSVTWANIPSSSTKPIFTAKPAHARRKRSSSYATNKPYRRGITPGPRSAAARAEAKREARRTLERLMEEAEVLKADIDRMEREDEGGA